MVLNELMYRRRSVSAFDLATLEAELDRKLFDRGSWAVPDDNDRSELERGKRALRRDG